MIVIKLNEIPEGGKDFSLTQRDGEMAALLSNILHGAPFEVHAHIIPAGAAYNLRGTLRTQLKLECAFCATEFQWPLCENFHDLLVPAEKTKIEVENFESDYSESEVSMTEVLGNQYNLGEYVREVLALAEPFQPRCRPDCQGLCAKCGVDKNQESCGCPPEKNDKPSPFSVLKALKLD